MPEAGVQAAPCGGSRSTAQSLPSNSVSQDWPLRALVPSHGGRACEHSGAVLGGSAVWGSEGTAQMQTLQGHLLLVEGTMGLCPGGAGAGERQEQDPPQREHYLWAGDLGPRAGYVSRAWRARAGAEPPPAGKQG